MVVVVEELDVVVGGAVVGGAVVGGGGGPVETARLTAVPGLTRVPEPGFDWMT